MARRRASLWVVAALFVASCGGKTLAPATSLVDAGPDPAPPTRPTIDAAPPPKDASAPEADAAALSCRDPGCSIGEGTICCVITVPGKVVASSCGRAPCTGGPGESGQAFSCDGPEDCSNNDVCCAFRGGGSACIAAEQCAPNTDNLQVCRRQADCETQPGTTCCAPSSQEVVPIGICREACN